jgi:hypothetical protein
MAREFTKKELSKQQKARALRVDHEYYNKPHPWRSLMKVLTFALPVVALAGLGAFALIPSGANIYMPGPVSTKHGIFAERCEACHEAIKDASGKMTFGQVTDAKCTACHDGPVHHENQVYKEHLSLATVNGKEVKVEAPGCATCHAEHATNVRLTEIGDRHCTQCHENLQVSSGTPKFASGIKHFNEGHPEFKAKQSTTKDMAEIKFGHAVHIGPASNVKKPDGTPLGCVDCHRPDKQRAYMIPINYETNCRSCHDIGIPEIANIGVVKLPHTSPDLVSAKLKTAFSDYLLKNGGKLPAKKEPNPKYVAPKPGRPKPKEPEFIETPDPRPADEWLKESVNNSLKPMFFPEKGKESSSCNFCHTAEGKDDASGLPKLAKTGIPGVWFAHARFNHEAHRVVECISCHTTAQSSKETADVLLPGIENCKTCHNANGARSGCNECHFFHDKAAPKVEGMLSIEELSKGTQKKAPAAAATPAAGSSAAPAPPAEPAPAENKTPADAPKEAPKEAPKDAK